MRYYPKQINIPSEQEIILSEMRSKIIETINNDPGISQTDISKVQNVSRQLVNYHLNLLKEGGLIIIEFENGNSKCYSTAYIRNNLKIK